MRRRDFIKGMVGSATAWPLAAHAQQAGKIYRIGILISGPSIGIADERRRTLISGLAERGFIEGRNVIFEQRSSDGYNERLSGLMAELKAAKVDIIATFGYPAAFAAKVSSKDIPIVVSGAGVPHL